MQNNDRDTSSAPDRRHTCDVTSGVTRRDASYHTNDQLEENVIVYDVPSDYEDSFTDTNDTLTAENPLNSSGETTTDETVNVVECKSSNKDTEVRDGYRPSGLRTLEEVARLMSMQHVRRPRMSYRLRAAHYDADSSSDDDDDEDDDDDASVNAPRNDRVESKFNENRGDEAREAGAVVRPVFVFGTGAVFGNNRCDSKATEFRFDRGDLDMDQSKDFIEYYTTNESKDERGEFNMGESNDKEGAFGRDDFRMMDQGDSKMDKALNDAGTSKEHDFSEDRRGGKVNTCRDKGGDVKVKASIDGHDESHDVGQSTSVIKQTSSRGTIKQRRSRSWSRFRTESNDDDDETDSSDDDDDKESSDDDDEDNKESSDDDDDEEDEVTVNSTRNSVIDSSEDDTIVFETPSNDDNAHDDNESDDDIKFDENCDSNPLDGSNFIDFASDDLLCPVDFDDFESESEESDSDDSDTPTDIRKLSGFNFGTELDSSSDSQESMEEEQELADEEDEFMEEGCKMIEVNQKWKMFYSDDIKENSANLKKPHKSVSFSTSEDTHILVLNSIEWAEEYAAARVGPWMTYALDASRFKHRVHQLQPTIEWVFTASHRSKIFNALQRNASEQALIDAMSALAI